MKALEAQLHSQQETDELQQSVSELKQRLSESSSDIVAKQNELKSLEAECQKECQKLMLADDRSKKIDMKRYLRLIDSACGMTSLQSVRVL